jgi:hypothetical protein
VLRACCCRVECREQLAPAIDADFAEDGFEVILDRVVGDEQSLADRAGVEARRERRDDCALARRERVDAAEDVEGIGRRGRSAGAGASGDRTVTAMLPSSPSPLSGEAWIISHRPSIVRSSAWASASEPCERASVATG